MKIKKNKVVGIMIIMLFSFSCKFYSDKNLGNNYLFWEDGNQSEIIYSENGENGGFTIIDANVSQYNFNNKYIIAKSNWLKNKGNETYWIIDKSIIIKKDTLKKGLLFEQAMKKALIGPLTKDSFNLFMKTHNINLKLKKAIN